MMTTLTRPERQLVAAAKAGRLLDLSGRRKRGRTVRATVLRDILLSDFADESGAGSVRLRGALIEGDLDLTNIHTSLDAELTDCYFARIQFDRAIFLRLTRHELSVGEVPGEKAGFGASDTIWKTITKEPALLTVLLSAFVVIKVIYVAQGNIQTALGVFSSAGVPSVIAGGLLSAFPLLSATVLGLASFEFAWTHRNSRVAPSTRRQAVVLQAIWAAAVVTCILLTPWAILASSVALGVAFGLAVRMAPRIHKAIFKGAIFILLSVASIYLVVNPLLYAVWLPHETVAVAGWKHPVAGYVLSDSNGWVSVLETGKRRIRRLASDNVTGRSLCQGRTVPMPLLPDWLKDSDSLWQKVEGTGVLRKVGLKVHILRENLPKCR